MLPSLLRKVPALACAQHQTCSVLRCMGRSLSTTRYWNEGQSARQAYQARSSYKKGKQSFSRMEPDRYISDRLLRTLKSHGNSSIAPAPKNVHAAVKASPLSELPTEDLVQLLHAPTGRQMEVETIELVLIRRLPYMPLSLALQAAHGFYAQNYQYQLRTFLSHMFTVVDNVFTQMEPSASEVTLLLFYVFLHGSAPRMLFHQVEAYLREHLEEFHINDLGVICSGFFGGNERILSQDLLDKIATKLLSELDYLEPFLLSTFMKAFRQANYIRVSFYEQLGNALVDGHYLSKHTSINTLMHLAFSYASIHVIHTKLFECLFCCIEKHLGVTKIRFRTKDMSKLVWACGTLQFKPENFEARYGQLIQRFEAENVNSRVYPESLAELLMGLAYLGMFPTTLIHVFLSDDTVGQLYKARSSKEKNMQLLFLNESVQLECPQYTGSLLSETQVRILQERDSEVQSLESDFQKKVGLLAAASALEQSLGRDKVHCFHPLPHFKTAVIGLQYCRDMGFVTFTLDRTMSLNLTRKANVSQLKEDVMKDQVSSDKPVSSTRLATEKARGVSSAAPVRLALVVTSRAQYALNDQTQELGHLHTMGRQLIADGYIVIKITPMEAVQLELSSHDERLQFLSSQLSSALNSSVSLSSINS